VLSIDNISQKVTMMMQKHIALISTLIAFQVRGAKVCDSDLREFMQAHEALNNLGESLIAHRRSKRSSSYSPIAPT